MTISNNKLLKQLKWKYIFEGITEAFQTQAQQNFPFQIHCESLVVIQIQVNCCHC
jgi:hypothetical protein